MAKKYILKEPAFGPELKIDYAKELNAAQLEVVKKAEGPCLVLAGAGSGKTRTLVYRVLYLLEKGVHPDNILLVTFTNKAAFEMRSRVERHLGAAPRGLWCGTFHHIGHRTLRMHAEKAGLTDSFSILDEEDSRDLVRSAYEVLPFKPAEAHFPKPNVVHGILSFAVNVCRPIPDVLAEHYPYFSHFESEIRRVAAEYDSRKRKSNCLDYDDLLVRWIRLLEDQPDVRAKFTRQFRYCLVDEYQDTNRLQGKVIDILSEEHRNLLVVGDDAQSIYSFRGAEIRNILDFPKQHPGAQIFKLETNYRSTPEVLALANDSIRRNASQFAKELQSVRPQAALPQVVRVRDVHEQSAFIVQRILETVDSGVELDQIAVLFRARYHAAELELELAKRRIRYVLRGGVRFFEQAHIKDVLSHLKIIVNPQDELSWFRALRQYAGIGEGYAFKLYQSFMQSGGSDPGTAPGASIHAVTLPAFGSTVSKRIQAGLREFKKLLKAMLAPDAFDRPDKMIDRVLTHGYVQYARTHFENAQDRLDDLGELINFAHTYKSLDAFLDDVSLRESFKGESIGESPDGDEGPELVLSTIHQAKGLEWKMVFIIGLSEGQFPHYKSAASEKDLEEERRLFYVASTRAKDELTLVHSMTRFQYDRGTVICRPSPFLTELSGKVYETLEVERSEEAEPGETPDDPSTDSAGSPRASSGSSRARPKAASRGDLEETVFLDEELE